MVMKRVHQFKQVRLLTHSAQYLAVINNQCSSKCRKKTKFDLRFYLYNRGRLFFSITADIKSIMGEEL